jgi:hypothetical protein
MMASGVIPNCASKSRRRGEEEASISGGFMSRSLQGYLKR